MPGQLRHFVPTWRGATVDDLRNARTDPFDSGSGSESKTSTDFGISSESSEKENETHAQVAQLSHLRNRQSHYKAPEAQYGATAHEVATAIFSPTKYTRKAVQNVGGFFGRATGALLERVNESTQGYNVPGMLHTAQGYVPSVPAPGFVGRATGALMERVNDSAQGYDMPAMLHTAQGYVPSIQAPSKRSLGQALDGVTDALQDNTVSARRKLFKTLDQVSGAVQDRATRFGNARLAEHFSIVDPKEKPTDPEEKPLNPHAARAYFAWTMGEQSRKTLQGLIRPEHALRSHDNIEWHFNLDQAMAKVYDQAIVGTPHNEVMRMRAVWVGMPEQNVWKLFIEHEFTEIQEDGTDVAVRIDSGVELPADKMKVSIEDYERETTTVEEEGEDWELM